MRALVFTLVAACSMLMVIPVMAADIPQQSEGDVQIEEARSRSRSSRSSKSKSSKKKSSRRGSKHSAHSGSSRHGSGHHSARHSNSRPRYTGHHGHHGHHYPRPPRYVVHRRGHPRHLIVVHPSSSRYDRRSDRVETRRVRDKAQRFSMGVGLGWSGSQQFDGRPMANYGVEGQARYRFADPFGVELAFGVYGDFRRDVRTMDVPLSASAMLHTPGSFPLGAFAFAGATAQYRDYNFSGIGGEHVRGVVGGPHAGVGVNINLGPNATVEWDVKASYMLGNTLMDRGGSHPAQVGSSLSFNYYF